MDTRIPLSIVLNSSGRKQEIFPSRTYTAAATSTFFRYLRSDDTRLPRHPLLHNYAEPAENYETYVGEDDWADNDNASRSASDVETPVSPVPVVDEVVEWVSAVLAEPWAEEGVVLCGRYTVADDCAWATSSRSSRLTSLREVFLAMRGSNKFFQDIKYQLGAGKQATAEFTIARAVAAEESKELRAFVPFVMTIPASAESQRSGDSSEGPTHVHIGSPQYAYAGVSQRTTEACFPSLMEWSEEEHDVIFKRVLDRIQEARLLERTCESDDKWCARLVARFYRRQNSAAMPGGTANNTADTYLWLFLSVDVLFDSLQLPIYLLSAKVRLFLPSTAALHTSIKSLQTPPFIAEPSETATEGVPQDSKDDGEDGEDEEDGDDWEVTRELADVRSFFRLFRDEFNWNAYAALMHDRLASHETQQRSPVRHFCAIASEASDLITCGDTLTKRGLPLEFSRPELLTHNPQALQHLQEFLQRQQAQE